MGRVPAIATALGLLAVLLLIVTTAFFVAAEFALVAVDRARLENLAEQGSRRAQVALAVVRRLSFHLSGAQLGVTLTSLLLGFIAEPTLVHALRAPVSAVVGPRSAQTVAVVVALTLATVVSMVVGELIPKGLVLARPVRAALNLAAPLRLFSLLCGPFLAVANRAANAIVRLFGVEPRDELTAARSVEELRALVRTSGEAGGIAAGEVALLTRALRFAEKTAEDVMVPRPEVVSIARDATVAELIGLARRTGHSRFPIVDRDADEILGIAPVKAVFRLEPRHRATTSVSELMMPILAVPENRALTDLLDDLQRQRVHLAVVLDEYGTTAGIVTVEDVLEEIVGEIADEYDPPDVSATAPGPGGSLDLPGGLRADEVADAAGFVLPDGQYFTLAGFVVDRLGHLPQVGEVATEDGWTFTVAEVDRHRVTVVRVLGPERTGGKP